MPTNNWQIGALYGGGLVNGQPFYTQEFLGGPVMPRQPQNEVWPDWPAAGVMVYSFGAWWYPPCLHALDFLKLIQEYDYDTNSSVMLVCCSVCQFVIRTIEPASEAYNPIQNAIIIA